MDVTLKTTYVLLKPIGLQSNLHRLKFLHCSDVLLLLLVHLPPMFLILPLLQRHSALLLLLLKLSHKHKRNCFNQHSLCLLPVN